jgi:hypothetical protein
MILSTDDLEAREKLTARLGAFGDPALMEEVDAARDAFDQAREDAGRVLPPDFFVLMGPKPPARIDLRALAAPRDLFGAEDDPTRLWDR